MGTAFTGSQPDEAGELVPGTMVGEYRIEGTLRIKLIGHPSKTVDLSVTLTPPPEP